MSILSATPDAGENRYLNRSVIALIAIAMIGFALFNLSGATDITQMPLITHVHAVGMSAWLILLLVQSHLGSRGHLTLHRPLGWFGAALAAFIVITGLMTAFHSIAAGRVPPFFQPGYFLMLGTMNFGLFSAFVIAAILMRKTTAWHRRLMLGALIMIFEPVLGRIIPLVLIPIMGGPEVAFPVMMEQRGGLELLRAGAHLGIVAVLMVGDRLVTGRIHPAYPIMAACVAALYLVVNTVGALAPVTEFATGLQGS